MINCTATKIRGTPKTVDVPAGLGMRFGPARTESAILQGPRNLGNRQGFLFASRKLAQAGRKPLGVEGLARSRIAVPGVSGFRLQAIQGIVPILVIDL